MDEEDLTDLVGSYVLHVPTLVVGRVKARWYDGQFVSPVNGKAVPGDVIQLEDGNAMVAKPGVFLKMGKPEIRFFQTVQEGLAGLVAVAAKTGHGAGVDLETGYTLTIAALRAQLAALEAG